MISVILFEKPERGWSCGIFLPLLAFCESLLELVVYKYVQETRPLTQADRVYVSLGTAGTYPGYGLVY